MPLYEYRCEACGHVFEQIRKFSDPPIEVCPKCGERKVEKLLSSPAIQFKGTGWYITDYARKGKDDKGTDKGPDAAAKPGGTEAKARQRRLEELILRLEQFLYVFLRLDRQGSRRLDPRRKNPETIVERILAFFFLRTMRRTPLDVFRAEVLAEWVAQIGPSQCEIHRSLQVAEFVACIVPGPFDLAREDLSLL